MWNHPFKVWVSLFSSLNYILYRIISLAFVNYGQHYFVSTFLIFLKILFCVSKTKILILLIDKGSVCIEREQETKLKRKKMKKWNIEREKMKIKKLEREKREK